MKIYVVVNKAKINYVTLMMINIYVNRNLCLLWLVLSLRLALRRKMAQHKSLGHEAMRVKYGVEPCNVCSLAINMIVHAEDSVHLMVYGLTHSQNLTNVMHVFWLRLLSSHHRIGLALLQEFLSYFPSKLST